MMTTAHAQKMTVLFINIKNWVKVCTTIATFLSCYQYKNKGNTHNWPWIIVNNISGHISAPKDTLIRHQNWSYFDYIFTEKRTHLLFKFYDKNKQTKDTRVKIPDLELMIRL